MKRTRKYVKKYGFLSFAKNLSNKYLKEILDAAPKRGLDPLKTDSKKLIHKIAEAAGESIQNKIAEKNVKIKLGMNVRNEEETVIPPEKIQETLNNFR